MIERLRRPGGWIGTGSVVCAAALALIGGLLVVAMLIRLAIGGSFWSDTDSDVVITLVLAALGVAGAVGLLVQDRAPWPGAALAALGGISLALPTFWAVVPLLLAVATVVVAVVRARALSPHPATP